MNTQVSYFKKVLVVLMAVMMVFTMMPSMAWAVDDVDSGIDTSTESIQVVTDLKIVAGNYSANYPDMYLDALDGNFNNSKKEYHDLVVTDVGYKVYVALSDEIKAMGNVLSYDVFYNGESKTSGVLNNGGDGFMQPFNIVASYMTSGAETLIELQVGLKIQGEYTTSETYKFYTTLRRGLKKLSVMENGKNVLTPASTTAANTLTDEFYGNIASGTESISMTINPTAKSATAYVGGTQFTSRSKAMQIGLENYTSEDGKSATIPVQLEWPSTDSTQPAQVRKYTVHLTFIDYTPKITAQPTDVTCKKDETVTLTVAASAPEGAALSYQWYEQLADGKAEIKGAKSETYTPSTEEVGEKTYYCIVTNTFNGKDYIAQSANAKVTVVSWEVRPPKFIAQPSSVTCKQNDKIFLSVEIEAPEAGTIFIQWFKNDVALGESNPILSVDTSEEGKNAYYCRIDWIYKNNTYHFQSQAATVTVDNSYTGDNYTPVIKQQPVGITCNKGDEPSLSVQVEEPSEGNLSYQWYYQPSERIIGATSNVFTPQTNTSGQTYYYCVVTNEVNGVRYSVQSEGVWVTVRLTKINVPTIVRDFGSYYKPSPKLNDETDYKTEYLAGVIPDYVYLTFEQSDSGVDYALEVYHSDTLSFDKAERVEGAKTRKVRTYGEDGVVKRECYVNLNKGYEEGTHYFFCKVIASAKNDDTVPTASLLMGPVKITFKAMDIGLEGTGSVTDPYKIKTQEDLSKLEKLVAGGQSFAGKNFQIVNDITLPEDWKPIGYTKDGTSDIGRGANLNAFSGTIDGKMENGKNATITVPKDGLPLLGYINGATVRNLNIYGEQINGAGLVNNYTGVGLSGNAITIENVTIKKGTSTLKSGFIASSGGNGFACASAGFVVTIRDCVVEEGVTIGYDGTQDMIGSFAGRINGIIESCSSAATVKGRHYVGGILASRDNAMSQCVVKNCTFSGSVEASGSYAGGIVGGGYDNATAPNGASPTIIACTVTGSVTGNEAVGGIFGGDAYVAQTWDNVVGSISANRFSGKVSGTKYVGAIIGYRNSLNRYDTIKNNFYIKDCGTENAIGFVKYLDTSYKNPTKPKGTIVFSTENGTKDCPTVEGCAWKAKHNRTDDPLGKDMENLAKMVDSLPNEAICYELVLKEGKVKTDYYLGEDFSFGNAKFTAKWTDGTEKEVAAKDITVSGYNKNSHSIQNVTLTCGYGQMSVQVAVKQKESGDDKKDTLTVSFTLLGDSVHDEADQKGGPHGLAMGGLSTWMSGSYEVKINSTVWDLMQQIQRDNSKVKFLARDSQYGTYVEGVTYDRTTLREFDNGNLSGWMYTLNGRHPEVGVAAQFLSDRDAVVFHYTDDYTKEEGSEKWNTPGGAEEEVKDVTTDTKAGITTAPTEVKVSEKTNADGTKTKVADVKVSADNQKEILKQVKDNKSNEIILVVSSKSVGDATKADVTLDKSFINSIVKDTNAKLTIRTPFGDKTYTQEELKAMSEAATGATVTVAIEKAAEEEPQTDVKALTAKLTPVARSAKTAKKNVKVTVSLDKQDKAMIQELKDAGYTVKYRFYRSTKKAAGYKAAVTKKTASYINTGGKKGTKYFYKVQVRAYDENGKLVAKTALKQCKYATRTWSKAK